MIYDDFIGNKYGKLTCMEFSHKEKGVGYFYKFRCDCGNEKVYNFSRVKNGYVKSCGCLRKENLRRAVFQDLTGRKFNYLEVIEYSGQKNGRTMWKCKCECGKITEVDTSSLKCGNTKSCGCHKKDGWKNNKIHGLSGTRIYRIWSGMRDRCRNKNNPYYCNYGGRGISVCENWCGNGEFENFYNWSMQNGYEENLTIDRINNNGNYEPSNCRWVTRFTQMNNMRKNHFIEWNGETHTIAEWSRKLNIPYCILSSRISDYNWDIDKALSTPPMKRGGNHKTVSCW